MDAKPVIVQATTTNFGDRDVHHGNCPVCKRHAATTDPSKDVYCLCGATFKLAPAQQGG